MSDIAEKLRNFPHGSSADCTKMMNKAADHIERLEAENEQLRKDRDKWKNAWADLDAECDAAAHASQERE